MNMETPDTVNIPNSSPEMAVLRKLRVGLGMDVHAFAPNRKLILGGVDIPHHQGLDGHSDADVLLHAIADALLGAARLGDIGKHFPDTDPAYKDADSLKLLEAAANLLREEGFEILDIDCRTSTEAFSVSRGDVREHCARMRHRNGKYRRKSHHHRTSRFRRP